MFFSFFSHCLCELFTNNWGNIFKTKKRFCKEQTHSQKPLLVLHMCHGLEDSNESLHPIFPNLKINVISCFTHLFKAYFPRIWRWILKNQKRFLSITVSYPKTSLGLCISIIVWKIRRDLWTLFFRNLSYFSKTTVLSHQLMSHLITSTWGWDIISSLIFWNRKQKIDKEDSDPYKNVILP